MVYESTIEAVFCKFKSIVSCAVKDNNFGWAKGGILLAYNLDVYEAELLAMSSNFIFVKIRYIVSNFNCSVLGLVYIPSDADMINLLDNINVSLNFIGSKYPRLPLVVGGNFKSRISQLNQLDKNILKSVMFFTEERVSRDLITNFRCRSLVNFMESFDFILLNGRSLWDTSTKYTFVEPQGSSVIDFVWCTSDGLPLFCDFRVL